MANDVKFEGKERRIEKIEKCLAEYGIESLEAARELCLSKGIDVNDIIALLDTNNIRVEYNCFARALLKSTFDINYILYNMLDNMVKSIYGTLLLII